MRRRCCASQVRPFGDARGDRHDLSDSSGHADLLVDGLRFDKAMQPDALTRMALGVIANVEGTVTGKGRIDWNARGVTSSGRFSSTGLDLAAAFGPRAGWRGRSSSPTCSTWSPRPTRPCGWPRSTRASK
jgi:hypothetical protein